MNSSFRLLGFPRVSSPTNQVDRTLLAEPLSGCDICGTKTGRKCARSVGASERRNRNFAVPRSEKRVRQANWPVAVRIGAETRQRTEAADANRGCFHKTGTSREPSLDANHVGRCALGL